MKDGFRLFDAHCHLGHALHATRSCSVEQMLESMETHGIDRALLIPYPVVRDEKVEHDLIGDAVRRYPKQFCGTVCLDPYQPHEQLRDEMRRCVEELGFRALKLQPQYHGLDPMGAAAVPYWEAAVEHKLPVVVHTGTGAPFALPSLLIPPARRFPELRLIVAHAGGAIYSHEAIVAASVCPNIYVEFSTLMPHHMMPVIKAVESNRLMVGSDMPESVATEFGKVLGLGVDEKIKADILWNTAAELFGDGA